MALKKVFPYQYGHDTEFFLWDVNKHKVVPSYKFFGTKEEEPKHLPGNAYPGDEKYYAAQEAKPCYHLLKKAYKQNNMTINSGGAFRFYRDGLAVEFNSSPVSCRAWIWQDLKLAMALADSIKQLPSNVKFTSKPYVEITPQLMRFFPKDLRVLGCSPTLDAYTEQMKSVLVNPMKTYFRTSGAHLHCSFETAVPEESWSPIIKIADLLIGVPHTYIFGDELEFKRRKLYGTAGEFRYQTYPDDRNGLEYRALSSRLYNHPGIFGLFSGLWKYIVTERYADIWDVWDKSLEPEIQEAINLGTPSVFPKLLEAGNKLVKQFSSVYRIKLEQNTSPLEFLAKLKELNASGAFPDAGVINNVAFPEAHKGWSEYATAWRL